MEPKSKEIIERFKEKIPLIKHVDYTLFGITQLDIICEDKSTKQYVLAFERLKFIEPTEFITTIYADVYIRIRDEILLQIALKEISIDEAISQKLFRIYGDKDIWKIQLKALREILPNEHFTPIKNNEPEEETIEVVENEEVKEEEKKHDESFYKRADSSTLPPHLKFLEDSLAELNKKFP